MEVASLKNIFFLAVLKLDVKDSFGYNKEIERMATTYHYTNIAKNAFCQYKHYLACTLEWTWKWKSDHSAVVLHG